MYLSRVELDIYNRKKMRDLNNLNSYHGYVESAFPGEIKEATRSRKLWRIDKLDYKKYLIILSKDKPDIEILEKYGIEGSAIVKDYNKLLSELKVGTKARFRLKLNTVKSLADGQKTKRGKIVPVPLNELGEFFLERTEKNGFRVEKDEFDIVERTSQAFRKIGNRYYDLVGTTYEGILTIMDLEKFKETLTFGIGRKKAYGFGFLTIIPYDK